MPPQRITLEEFDNELIQRTKDKFDNILIVESGSVKGAGKTTFSMLSGRDICDKSGWKYSIEENMILNATNEKIAESIEQKPFGFPIHIDEGIKVAYRRNWNADPQKKTMQLVAVCRRFHKIVYVNNPAFITLDKDLLDLADYRITILIRGIALVFGKSKDPNDDDKWMIKETRDMMKNAKVNKMNVDEILRKLRNAPNCIYEIHYPDIDKQTYDEYERLSRQMEMEDFKEGSESIQQTLVDAAYGILGILKNKYDSFTWVDVAIATNRYMALKNQNSFLKPVKLRERSSEVLAVGFADFFKFSKEKPPESSDVVVTPDASYINKNNTKEDSDD